MNRLKLLFIPCAENHYRPHILGRAGIIALVAIMLVAAGKKVPGYDLPEKPGPDIRRRAKLALEMFCYDVARYVGSYAAVMGGADAIVFTAGVGERSKTVRDMVMSMVKLPGKPKVLVVPTNEELMIAKEAKKTLKLKG